MISIAQLGIEFFFNGIGNVQKAEKARDVVDGLLAGAAKVGAAVVAINKVGKAISDFVDKTAKLKDLSEYTGDSIDSLKEWSSVIRGAGGDADKFLGTVDGIGKSLKKAMVEDAEFTTLLSGVARINPLDDNGELKGVTDILYDLAGAWNHLSKSNQIYLGEKLGLDRDTIRLLQMGQEYLKKHLEIQDRIRKEHGLDGEEQAKSARKLKSLWYGIADMLDTAAEILITKLNPYLEKVLGVIHKIGLYTLQNKDVFEQVVTGLAFAVGMVLLPALKLLGAVVLKLGIVFAPILIKAALLSALIGYLVEDFREWKKTGQSTLGVLWKGVSDLWVKLEGFYYRVKAIFKRIWDDPRKAFEDFIGYFQNRWKGLSLFEIAKDILKSFIDGVKTTWDALVIPFLGSIDAQFKEWFGVDLSEAGTGMIASLWSGFNASLSTLWNGIISMYNQAKSMIKTFKWAEIGVDVGSAIANAIIAAMSFTADLLIAIKDIDWESVGTAILKGLLAVLEAVAMFIGALLQILIGAIAGIVTTLLETLKDKVFGWIDDIINEIKSIPGVSHVLKLIDSDKMDDPNFVPIPGVAMLGNGVISQAMNPSPAFASPGIMGARSGDISGDTTVTVSAPINISGAGDPERVATAAANELAHTILDSYNAERSNRR
jgi:hypothetical protein